MNFNASGCTKNSFEFNKEHKPYIDEIAALLSKNFPIKFFGFLRFYSNGHALAFSNNLKWQSFFLESINKNSKSFEKATSMVNSKRTVFIHLWPDIVGDKTLDALRSYNIWNGMSIYRYSEGYIDSWSFAGEMQDEKLYILFAKYSNIFEQFIYYVEAKYSFLFDVEGDALFKFSSHDLSENLLDDYCSPEKINQFISHSPIFKTSLNKCNLTLTSRENTILKSLQFGMTAKEMARELLLSPRTVECHVKNLKIKLGCYRKSELIRKYRELI